MGYLVSGAGSQAYDGCLYRRSQKGHTFALDESRELYLQYSLEGVWRLGESGKDVGYLTLAPRFV